MAEPLKNSYGTDIPRTIAQRILGAHSSFPSHAFLLQALDGYLELELLDRGRHIAAALAAHLPSDFRQASQILVASMGPKLENSESFGMGPFLYLPYAFFVANHGLGHWKEAMHVQYELTQRFTAEFCIRPFLIHHTEKTLARLHIWASDPSVHVRRLVSEGTRPRLPWAPRLPQFQKDPRPVLNLLEKLKDDKELYVRRSVANNLNDIGKDNPKLLLKTAEKWLKPGVPEREWIVRHALRSLIKQGDKGAMSLLGFGKPVKFGIRKINISKGNKNGKKSVQIAFEIFNRSSKSGLFLVDFQVHYPRSNKRVSKKVFKLGEIRLAPHHSKIFRKSISLEDMTTRKHYPGRHKIDVLVNGQSQPLGGFSYP